MRLVKIVLLLMSLSLFNSINAQEFGRELSEDVSVTQSLRVAPIKNKSDLDLLLNKQNPLDLLSPLSEQVFLDSLVFTKAGLASFNYQVLEDELEDYQIYQVLSLFGVQNTLITLNKLKGHDVVPSASGSGPHYKGYACVAAGTCKTRKDAICISENCKMGK